MRFSVSTRLYHERRLERDHLAEIASYGFEAVELFATRSHFDYHDQAAIGRLKEWLDGTGLALDSVHAPIAEGFGREAQATYSNAATDRVARETAVRETEAALRLADSIPFDVLVVHLGTPASQAAAGDNHRPSAVRSFEEISEMAARRGVRVACEVIANRLSDAGSLAAMLDQQLDARHAGICLDFGHAHLMENVVDAIEAASEHIIATHVHDNRGREDAHLVPGLGTIDWSAALMTMQKIGYAGTYVMELANTSTPGAVLEAARRARQRFERALAD